MRELYVMALYATRPADEGEAGDDHEVSLRVALAVEADQLEARAHGLARLFEVCPHDEGWVNHHVSVTPVSREQLRSVFDALSGEDEEGDGRTTELIM